MANSFTVVCLIINKISSKNFINGTAAYRFTQKVQNFLKYFDYRLFDNGSNKNIQNFEEGDVVMFSGKFTYRKDHEGENPMFVCLSLNLFKFNKIIK